MKKISIKQTFEIEADYSLNTKEEVVLNWLLEMRNFLLVNKIATFGDIIPTKQEISSLLNISTGTVQNAIKYAEDLGFFISRQCVGTIIADPNAKTSELKMYSKKDKAILEIKRLLASEKYEQGEIIPNIVQIASYIKTSQNTTRLALRKLLEDGILRKEEVNNKEVLILNSEVKLSEKEKAQSPEIKNRNLVKILKENIKKFLFQNYKKGEKIPTNSEFAKMFNVSIKTVNSATKELNKEKVILSRRGKYGSLFLAENVKNRTTEKSMFMSKPKGKADIEKNYNYRWELVFENIKKYILKNCEAGDKIPSIKDFAQKLNTSTTTIRRAIYEFSRQGILYAQKGKYGGLFIVEMPEKEDSYRWLAINSDII